MAVHVRESSIPEVTCDGDVVTVTDADTGEHVLIGDFKKVWQYVVKIDTQMNRADQQ
jgi:hypothetical protein